MNGYEKSVGGGSQARRSAMLGRWGAREQVGRVRNTYPWAGTIQSGQEAMPGSFSVGIAPSIHEPPIPYKPNSAGCHPNAKMGRPVQSRGKLSSFCAAGKEETGKTESPAHDDSLADDKFSALLLEMRVRGPHSSTGCDAFGTSRMPGP